MNTALKILVAAACVAVIGVAGVWWLDRADQIKKAEERKAWIAAQQDAEIKRNCEEMVSNWDKMQRKQIIAKYGVESSEAVDRCRFMLELMGAQGKP